MKPKEQLNLLNINNKTIGVICNKKNIKNLKYVL